MSEPGVFEIMPSMRAMRWLKPDPVPDEVLREILDAAIRAPSGQNTWPWAGRTIVGADSVSRSDFHTAISARTLSAGGIRNGECRLASFVFFLVQFSP